MVIRLKNLFHDDKTRLNSVLSALLTVAVSEQEAGYPRHVWSKQLARHAWHNGRSVWNIGVRHRHIWRLPEQVS